MKVRSEQEEQTRQLKVMNAQMAPLGVFVKVGFYLFLGLTVLGCLARLFMVF
jgi:hypothetical protein